ncbi:MAG: flippase-like domain-containing protein [Bdellovibrionales bacterium]|nr:flippase-like domain-containing protein [Bdellovibrionales bacterium]
MSLKALIKVLISITMLTLVFSLVEPREVIATVGRIPLWCALAVVGGYLVGQALSAYKWMLLARSGKIEATYPGTLKAYFIGMFVNCFGLGIIGGDVTRGVLLADGKPLKTQAIASVVADRAHGLAVLAVLGTLATALFGRSTIDVHFVYLLVGIGLMLVLGWFIGPVILLKFVHAGNKLHDKAVQVAEVFPKTPSRIASITFLSLLFHLLQIGLHWLMGIGLGVELSWAFLLLAVPFINILSSLPISWNGLGVRETAYIFFFCNQSSYLSEEQAIAMGALWLLAVTSSSAIGGIVAFLTKDFQLLRKQSTATS